VTPERWVRIKEVFGPALETPRLERPAFLDSACGGDAELRAEVERLLIASDAESLHGPAGEFLNAAFLKANRELAPGDTVAHYRIEGKLGEGGMGVVYRALDTKLNRPVAIKFLSEELADAAARRRFQREAQMASSLNHPHILTVHDAGELEGRQYLVT
jgi:serine/threonine protein kinase